MTVSIHDPAMISGPTPAGSPIVNAKVGRLSRVMMYGVVFGLGA
jgi:hypothetical protein